MNILKYLYGHFNQEHDFQATRRNGVKGTPFSDMPAMVFAGLVEHYAFEDIPSAAWLEKMLSSRWPSICPSSSA